MIYVLLFVALCICLLVIGLSTAEEGWEDENGFHKGKHP